jgi:hypothetical protein
MISAPPLSDLELIPVPSHRPENSMYSSYVRSGGRTLKIAEDETSALQHHHHPAGIVIPRGMASNVYTSQHDTHASQYEVTIPICTQAFNG